jgi:hypothetical protein
LEDAKGDAVAQRFYGFVHNPLRSDAASPALQVVKQETHDGDAWMQLSSKKSDKKKAEPQQTEYWIAISQDPKRNGVRRYEGPVTEPGHEKEPLRCVATYQPASNKAIEPPASTAALPEHDSGKPGPEFAADSLKYSRDFYSKVHFVAIADLSLGSAGTAEFKYDRYPNGGPERIQCDDGEFARKNGKNWLKSNDWGDTGKPADAQTSKRLNNWVGLIQARLNGEPTSNDPSEGATVMKFIGKEDEGEREEFVFEESKEKPKAKSYPHISFGRYKSDKEEPVLLSEFSGPNYIVPDEGIWCQSHPTECNMYNNASYKQFTVVGVNQPFTFNPVGNTVREQPAIMAWTGATVTQYEPDPGNDGIFFVGYKVTGPNNGVWHYEYAIYNQNLDRGIQYFEVVSGANPHPVFSNIGFHAPPQHPGFAHDGTVGDAGYSSTPWDVAQSLEVVSWSTETFAQNPNANAIRFGTLYNFRFDANEPPSLQTATIKFFKTGSQIQVPVAVPFLSDATPTPPPPSPTPTPRPSPIPRERPTPHPRP